MSDERSAERSAEAEATACGLPPTYTLLAPGLLAGLAHAVCSARQLIHPGSARYVFPVPSARGVWDGLGALLFAVLFFRAQSGARDLSALRGN
jgi:hypothetical protein